MSVACAPARTAGRLTTQSPSWRPVTRMAGVVAATLVASAGLVAVITRVAFASQARHRLGYTFPGVHADPSAAVGIFANNIRELLGVLGVLLIAQIAMRRTGGLTRAQLVVRTGAEIVLGAAVAINVLAVGAAVGAYGTRMVHALLPHGPVELAGFAVALALYLHGRTRALPRNLLVGAIAASVGLLAVAAVMETFV
jgi:hypothetical protein